MSDSVKKIEIDTLRLELEAAGIDIAKNEEWCRKASFVFSTGSTPEMGTSAMRDGMMGEEKFRLSITPDEIAKRLKALSIILLVSLVGLFVSAAFLVLGFVVADSAVFIARATVILTLVLVLFAFLVMLQVLWSAFLSERVLRKEADENFHMARDLLRALC